MRTPPALSEDTKFAMGCGGILLALGVACFGLSTLVNSCRGEGDQVASTPESFEDEGAAKAKKEIQIGTALEDLEMTSTPMSGYWREEDFAFDDEQHWIGSTCVIARSEGHLYLLTNRHCLGLESLAAADDDGFPEVADYRLFVHFPGNVIRQVKMFGLIRGNVDLAWLIVDGTGVSQTVSLGMPKEKLPPLKPGLEVVVVGSPMDIGLRGSHTFGRISALRPFTDDVGHDVQLIQTDAAINPGNSGGPVFVKWDGRYHWIGVAVPK